MLASTHGYTAISTAYKSRNPPTLYQVREFSKFSNDEPSTAISFMLRCGGSFLGLKASGDVAADYRADPNPTPIYMLQGATGEKRRNAPLFFTWLGLAPDPLPAITSRCNCEHTTPRAVKQSKQSHKQVHADTCSRSHTHTHVAHARVHLA